VCRKIFGIGWDVDGELERREGWRVDASSREMEEGGQGHNA